MCSSPLLAATAGTSSFVECTGGSLPASAAAAGVSRSPRAPACRLRQRRESGGRRRHLDRRDLPECLAEAPGATAASATTAAAAMINGRKSGSFASY